MDILTTISVLEALVCGCSPKTGEMVAPESILNERDVIRALQIAIGELKKQLPKSASPKNQKDNGHKTIDFFKKERFNTLTPEMINDLKANVDGLGILKSENLPDYMIKARISFPRAYEPWSEMERELFAKAIKSTNDVDLLSECFRRGKGSIESFGQKLLYESLSG